MDPDNGAFVINTADRTTYGIETNWRLKSRLYLPDSIMLDIETQIEDEFRVTLKDPCADNKLSITKANELDDKLYYIGDTAIPVRPVVDQVVPIATCPINAVLEFFDEKQLIWRDYSHLTSTSAGQLEHTSLATFTNTFITNFITTHATQTGWFDISLSKADALSEYDGQTSTHTEVLLRLTFTDQYSDELEKTVSDEFSVKIQDKCTLNELTLTEKLGDLLQYVSDPTSGDYFLNFSTLLTEPPTWPNCLITHTFEFWNV